ncbi:MAG: porin [Rikenellaceae bacterium]
MREIYCKFLLGLAFTFAILPSNGQDADLSPTLFGVAKVKMELSTDNGLYRFDVRNSRIGVKGNASERMNYAIQIDYNNEGNISILDSYVGYHAGGLVFKLGQQQINFSNDLSHGPASSPFSNRSFLSKYITTYFGTEVSGGVPSNYVKTMGSRDIGATIAYTIPNTIVKLSGGIFNGAGANNPEWGDHVNFVGRLDLGDSKEGLCGAVSCYVGKTPTIVNAVQDTNDWYEDVVSQNIQMYDAYVGYTKGDLFLEAEYAQRRIDMDGLSLMQAYYIHGTYRIAINNSPIFKYFAPHLRWDRGQNVEYLDAVTNDIFHYTSNRMTYSMNFGLSEKRIRSELRLAFEDYFVKEKPADYKENMLLHDKFTVEFVAAF